MSISSLSGSFSRTDWFHREDSGPASSRSAFCWLMSVKSSVNERWKPSCNMSRHRLCLYALRYLRGESFIIIITWCTEVRPPLEISLFPVRGPVELKSADWVIIFHIFKIFLFLPSISFIISIHRKKKKNPATLLALNLHISWTGNKLFF